MRRSIALLAIGSLVAAGLAGPLGQTAEAAKSKKRGKVQYQEVVPPAPVPFPEGTIVESDVPCCEHKCCKKRHRCDHECAPACPPVVEYKGRPAPCSIEKVVTVTYPKTCYTIDVVIRVPADECEEVDRERDGDLELDYGKYEVSLRWKDRGRRLVVDYDD